MKEYDIVTTVKVTQQELNDLLITAVEGGIGYWAQVRNWNEDVWGDSVEDITVEIAEDSEYTDTSAGWITLRASDLAKVLHRLPNYNIGNIKPGSGVREYIDNMDSDIADVAVQLVVFGELVYG